MCRLNEPLRQRPESLNSCTFINYIFKYYKLLNVISCYALYRCHDHPMDHILFSSLPSRSTVCSELRFPGELLFLFAPPHDSSEKLITSESIVKCHASRHCAKNNIYVALVLILRRARQKIYNQKCFILKNTKIWRTWMVSHHYSSDDVQSKQKTAQY